MSKLAMPFANPTTYPNHSGVDFGKPMNTPILASGRGFIRWSGYVNDRAGYGVIMSYDTYPGVEFLYCHQPVRSPRPAKGATVANGGFLGNVGSTGSRSTGPHLHLEVVKGKGAHTYDGVWLYFDRDRFIGDGSVASVNKKPLEVPPQASLPRMDNMFLARNVEGSVRLFTENGDIPVDRPSERNLLARAKNVSLEPIKFDANGGAIVPEFLNIELDIIAKYIQAADDGSTATITELRKLGEQYQTELDESMKPMV